MRKGHFDLKLLQLDILEQGDVFCHNAIIDHKSVDYTVITEVPCEVFIIKHQCLIKLSNFCVNWLPPSNKANLPRHFAKFPAKVLCNLLEVIN